MKKRIHFHTDCPFFAGCETMLANFFSDDRLMNGYEVSFSYRWSDAYERGLNARVTRQFAVTPLRLPDAGAIYEFLSARPAWLRITVRAAMIIFLARYWFVLWNTIRLAWHFRPLGIDLLHINNGNYPGAYSCMSAVFAARLCGIRQTVYVVNNIAVPYRHWQRWPDYPLDRLVASMASIFVTGSLQAATELKRVLGLTDSKAANLPNGVSPKPLTRTRDEVLRSLQIQGSRPVFAVIAVLEERKGYRVLIDALKRLQERGAALPVVVIVGVGSMKTTIVELVASAGLSGDIRFVDAMANVFDLLNASDALILPSVSNEDFPNVVIEAMSMGKPVIGTRLAGIPEQIEHMQSGVLVAPGDAKGLADAISLLTQDEELRSSLGRGARQRYQENFTAEIAVSRYLRLYERMT